MEEKIIGGMGGAGICGIISICICVVFFSLKKNYLNHMEDLPLDGGEKNSKDKNQPTKL